MRLLWPFDGNPGKEALTLPSPFEPVNSGTTARDGRRDSVSTSSGDLTVLSRYSRMRAKPMPPTKPTRKAKARLRVLAGRAGVEGIMAGSTTRILVERKPPAISVSLVLGLSPSLRVLFA